MYQYMENENEIIKTNIWQINPVRRLKTKKMIVAEQKQTP